MEKMGIFIFLFSIVSNLVFASSVSIRAIVNGDIITSYDVEERAKLSSELLKLNKVNMSEEQIKKQVLSEMIDDKIKIAEAEKYSIRVSATELDDAIKKMEKYLNLPAGGYDKIIKKIGIEDKVVKEQIKADVLWMKFVLSVLRSYIKVSDSEVNIFIDNIKNANYFEYKIATTILKKDENILKNLYAQNIDSCEKFIKNYKSANQFNIKDKEMSKELYTLTSRNNNKPFHLVNEDGNYQVFFVCDKQKYVPTFTEEEKEQIKFQIYQNKLDAYANKYFEKMKITSVIDLKE